MVPSIHIEHALDHKPSLMIELIPLTVYVIELCSGECRRWQYIGEAGNEQIVWIDVDTGREFNESSLMYAWSIIGRESEKSPDLPFSTDG